MVWSDPRQTPAASLHHGPDAPASPPPDTDCAGQTAITTPDFYAYDGGKRFTAQTLMELIKKLHAAGKHYEWNVMDPEVHIACNLAWVTYVNQGSIEDAAGHQDMTWLESVRLEYANGQWRARFFHSTRVPSTQ
jgi:hypothetical protein